MRRGTITVLMLFLAACGPETVRATGAPITPPPAAATASPSRAAATTGVPGAPTGATTSVPTSVPSATTSAPSALPSATTRPSATSTAAAVPALGSCASEPSLRPQAAGGAVPLVVSNETGARRDTSSLDAQGRRVPAKTLAPGESYTQAARVGDVWVVSDAGGVCVAIQAMVAPALLILSATRTSLLPLYAIRGRVTDAQTGSPLGGQSVFIWTADESSCAIIGGVGSPGYVVSSITAPDGAYGVYVTAGDYKVRVRTALVGGITYAPQWWRGRPAGSSAQCVAADVIPVNADATAIDFALPRQ